MMMPMVSLSFLSLSCWLTHDEMHFFPTRRSSDLVMIHGGDREIRPAHPPVVEPQALEGLRRGHLVDQVQVDIEKIRLTRSEEHTSELQSRRDLVCRLLLEKKKKTQCLSRLLS